MDAKLFLMAGCLAGIVSACMHEKSDDAFDIQKVVHALVLEADNLMQSDSLFWNRPIDKSHPQVCIHDSLIRQKLDSAIALHPDKQTYLLKYRYLLQSWRLSEVLDLLREMYERFHVVRIASPESCTRRLQGRYAYCPKRFPAS